MDFLVSLPSKLVLGLTTDKDRKTEQHLQSKKEDG